MSDPAGKLAFINCRTYTGGSGLINMPFAFNIVLELQKNWRIDLFLGAEPNPEYKPQLSNNVRIRHLHRALRQPSYLKDIALFWKCMGFKYRAVFGMGQVGTYMAYLLAKLNRCPLFTVNDEFPSGFQLSRWTYLDAKANRCADAIIIPDLNRVHALRQEISGLEAKPFYELLNIPLSKPGHLPRIDWHERLGLPAGAVPLIFVGGVGEHNQIPELLCSVHSWPEQYVLVIRAHNPGFAAQYKQALRHLDLPGRIFWCLDPLSPDEFDSLLSYCKVSFALYRPESPNMVEMGKASGKILRSISLGVPVIASSFPSLEFVESYGLGRLVNHPAEITSAIGGILEHENEIKGNCARFTDSHLSFQEGWSKFRAAFHSLMRASSA